MVMMTALPFAVSKPMTTAEIENFVEGSLPNGTIIENVNTGAIAVVNAGMPQYLPYAEGIIPDVSDFMKKPTATGSVGQVLTRANGSIPYTWADVPTGGGVSGGGFPQLVSSFMIPRSGQELRYVFNPAHIYSHVYYARSSDVGSAVLSSDFVEVQYHMDVMAPEDSSATLDVREFSVYTLADAGVTFLDSLYNVVMSPENEIQMDPGTSRSFDIKSGLIDLRNLSSNWSHFGYCPLGGFFKGEDVKLDFDCYSVLNFYKVM